MNKLPWSRESKYLTNHTRTVFGCVMTLALVVVSIGPVYANENISEASQQCVDCHSVATPAIVENWKRSRHSAVTPAEACEKKVLERRVSTNEVPPALANVVVGCAECHCMNADAHKDIFEHNEAKVHSTVTPRDCGTCHSVEADQYAKNIMSHANGNLAKNELFGAMMSSVNGVQTVDKDLKIATTAPDELTSADSCYSCHGTKLTVTGKMVRDTSYGDMEFLKIDGWPNQGVGRVNLDESRGSCSSCHTKHEFSIAMARKPYTCSQCHKGPDVPAYQSYLVSKHGNVYASTEKDWKMDSVPWVLGGDFSAPTCAVCHVSLVTSVDGEVIAQRTHQMNDRLPWRIFGVIYAHPHPKSPDTSLIRYKNGQPVPTSLDGDLATEFLITREEMNARQATLQKVCRGCHTRNWVDGHWSRFEQSLTNTNQMTLASTRLLESAWRDKLADLSNPFDEAIEKLWVEQWLFYANSTRFASAMLGADYGVFANGRWFMSKNLRDIVDRIGCLRSVRSKMKER